MYQQNRQQEADRNGQQPETQVARQFRAESQHGAGVLRITQYEEVTPERNRRTKLQGIHRDRFGDLIQNDGHTDNQHNKYDAHSLIHAGPLLNVLKQAI